MESLFADAFGLSDLDLYEDVLHVNKDCSPAQLRKAYYKQARQFHPDKNNSKEAKLKFQAISLAYSLLKDPNKRKEYDKHGEIPLDDDDEANDESKRSWKEYFDLIFGKLSTDDIDSFAEKYKMSEEEERDVLKNYVKFKGNLKKMLEFVMLSEERDVARWIEDYIQPAIKKNKVGNFEETLKRTAQELDVATKHSIDDNDPDETETEDSGDDDDHDVNIPKQSEGSGKVKKGKKSGKAVPRNVKSTRARKKLKKNSEEDLIAAIRKKNGRSNPLASIAARYGVSSIENDPLDESTFQKLQSKYSRKNGSK